MYQAPCPGIVLSLIQVYYYSSFYYIGDFSIPEIDDTTREDEEEQEELGKNPLVAAKCLHIQSPKHTAGSHNIALSCILGTAYIYNNYMPIWCSELTFYSFVYNFLMSFTFNLTLYSKPERFGQWATRGDRLVLSRIVSGGSLHRAAVHKTGLLAHWGTQEGGIAGMEWQRNTNLGEGGQCTCGDEKNASRTTDCTEIW